MTDVTNVQNAFQMIIRMCIRAPLMFIITPIFITTSKSFTLIPLSIIIDIKKAIELDREIRKTFEESEYELVSSLSLEEIDRLGEYLVKTN